MCTFSAPVDLEYILLPISRLQTQAMFSIYIGNFVEFIWLHFYWRETTIRVWSAEFSDGWFEEKNPMLAVMASKNILKIKMRKKPKCFLLQKLLFTKFDQGNKIQWTYFARSFFLQIFKNLFYVVRIFFSSIQFHKGKLFWNPNNTLKNSVKFLLQDFF